MPLAIFLFLMQKCKKKFRFLVPVSVFIGIHMSLSGKVSSELILRSHRALPMSIIRLVIRTLKCRIHGRLFGGSLGQCVRLIARVLGNQRHWHMAVMIVTWRHVRVLCMARDGIAARNIRTFRCSSRGRSAYQRHHKRLTVR